MTDQIAAKADKVKKATAKTVLLYQEIHESQGEYGCGSAKILANIIPILNVYKPKSLCDYGCGKNQLLTALKKQWPDAVPEPNFLPYDPAIPQYSTPPSQEVDFLICVDVFEHLIKKELDACLEHIASLAKNAYFFISCRRSSLILSNGQNAHCTIYPPRWWQEYLQKYFEIVQEAYCSDKSACAFLVSQTSLLVICSPDNSKVLLTDNEPKSPSASTEESQKIKQEVETIHNKLNCLKDFLILKEISPNMVRNILMPQNVDIYEDWQKVLTHQFRINNKSMQTLSNWFSEMYVNIAANSTYAVMPDQTLHALIQAWENCRGQTSETRTVTDVIKFLFLQHCYDKGYQELLFDFFKIFFEKPNYKHKSFTTTWLRYIVLLLEFNLREEALASLKNYMHIHKEKDLHIFFLLANAASSFGIRNADIDLTNGIYETVRSCSCQVTLEKILKDNNVAIVGNAPQEIGKGNGKIIDAHDTVIRFNHFKISPEFEVDYGKKTTLWVLNWISAKQGLLPQNDLKIDYVLYDSNMITTTFYKSAFEHMKSQLDLGRKVIFTSVDDVQIVRRMLGITLTPPTLGLKMMALLKHYNSNFSSDNLYGFSFNNTAAVLMHKPHHYFGPTLLARSTHNYDREKQLIERLLK